MSNVLKEVLTTNQQHAESFGARGSISLPPARQFAALTCRGLCTHQTVDFEALVRGLIGSTNR